MANTIAAFYADELTDWSHHIDLYSGEAEEFEERLKEVIQRNNIPAIGEAVDHFQDMLTGILNKLFRLQEEIYQQEEKLRTDGSLAGNSSITTETEKQQNLLRRFMQAVEKEYIDVKYACYDFLSGTLKK
ncbi:MAG: hypothetical protein JNK14_16685 [Chitinophagaceae bacterium]|nr:hypothetical protein [Chitinophagaceae bacterium]